MPHVMLPLSPFRRASIPDPHPPQPPVPDPEPEPGPSPVPDPDPAPMGRAGDRLDVVRVAEPEGGDDEDGEDEQADPGGDSDPHPPLPQPGAAA